MNDNDLEEISHMLYIPIYTPLKTPPFEGFKPHSKLTPIKEKYLDRKKLIAKKETECR